ncbi:hypothetical protein OS493_004707 [Desmophyllum pertusum]|uniref:Uncharacterized protein n=1 Tax=Desmophyllum pertusum TaxID=174260 RepID=A0A9W9ZHK1_9CNID|nr:hypothetical protein OS493_004707 [Desmophyllum pertusum]
MLILREILAAVLVEDHQLFPLKDESFSNRCCGLYLRWGLIFNVLQESSLEIEELRAGCTDEDGRDVTDSPFIPRDSTPSAPLLVEEPLDAERNNSSQEPGATHNNARLDDEDSAAKRLPEEMTLHERVVGLLHHHLLTILTENFIKDFNTWTRINTRNRLDTSIDSESLPVDSESIPVQTQYQYGLRIITSTDSEIITSTDSVPV